MCAKIDYSNMKGNLVENVQDPVRDQDAATKAYTDSAISGITVPVKSTGAEINTGTDDAKFVTPAAIVASHIGVVENLAEADLGTITIVGTWSTIDTKKYKCIWIANRVDFWIRLESTTAGSGVTAVEFDIPVACPAPAVFSTVGNAEASVIGVASVQTATNGVLVGGYCWIWKFGGAIFMDVYFPSTAVKVVMAHITYFI